MLTYSVKHLCLFFIIYFIVVSSHDQMMISILFLLYINNLPRVSTKLKFFLYAGDTYILYEYSDTKTIIKAFNMEMPKIIDRMARVQWITHRPKLNTVANKTKLLLNCCYVIPH